MATFDLNSFLGQVLGNDLARANRFEIQLHSPVGGDRLPSLLCEEAAIPGLQALWAPTKLGMWTENRVHGMEFFGEAAQFTFYCDTQWGVRSYLEAWMKRIANFETKEPNFYSEWAEPGSVEVKSLDRDDNITGTWTLKEAFPRLVNITPVGQGGDGIVRVSATFSYRSWESTPGAGGGGGFGGSFADILNGLAEGKQPTDIMSGAIVDVLNSQ